MNLYGFVYNSPIDWIDVLGNAPITPSAQDGWNGSKISAQDFYDKYFTEEEKKVADQVPDNASGKNLTWFRWGCIGVAHVLAGVKEAGEVQFSDCFDSEAKAIKFAKTMKCPDCDSPKIIGIKYQDRKKGQRRNRDDGSYPVDPNEVSTPKADQGKGPHIRYDFGFRQSDGSYIHATEAGEDMEVVHSVDARKFAADPNDHYNTTVFCVRCCSGERGDTSMAVTQSQ